MAAAKKKVAKKKVAKKKAPAKTSQSKELTDWKAQLAQYTAEQADRPGGGGGNVITCRNGEFKFQGSDLGDAINVVVLDYAYVNRWYDRVFDPENMTPPACIAISMDGRNMAPLDNSPDKQADACADCWANEFGTDNRGRGKACANTLLLAVIADVDLGKDDAEIATFSIPPASTANFHAYMKKRQKALNLPSFAFVTEISVDDEADYLKYRFNEIDRVPENHLPSVMGFVEPARDQITAEPDFSGYEPPPQRGKKKKASKKKKSRYS